MNRYGGHTPIAWIIFVVILITLGVFIILGMAFCPGFNQDMKNWFQGFFPPKSKKPTEKGFARSERKAPVYAEDGDSDGIAAAG